MITAVEEPHVRAYYDAALAALRFIEAKKTTAQRFGADADARWNAFAGDLKTADRLDLLIRDADAQWRGSFGARTVFAMRGVAEDDPFGPSWPYLDPVDAEEVWRARLAEAPADDVAVALKSCAEAWKLPIEAFDPGAVGAADKLLVVGPSAIVATAVVFADGADLDWAEQVVCCATPPPHRQLAAVVAALLNAPRACRLIGGEEQVDGSVFAGYRAAVSPDAQQQDAARAESIMGGAAGGAL